MNKSLPVVAVVIRTKDRGIFLDRAIKNVIAQTWKNLVMVIFNDGGTQKTTVSIVEKYKAFDKKVVVVHNKTPKGRWASANIGVKASKSDYIAFLDDDDTWHKDFLKESLEYLLSHPQYKGVITKSSKITERVVDKDIKTIKKTPFMAHVNEINLYKLCKGNLFPNNSFVYHRETLKKTGYYNSNLEVLGDWDFNIRFARHFEIAVINKVLAFVHHRKAEKSAYGNSVIRDLGLHNKYRNIILNSYIRQDLHEGKLGVGLLTNIANDNRELQDTLINHFRLVLKQNNRNFAELMLKADSIENIYFKTFQYQMDRYVGTLIKQVRRNTKNE